MRRRDSFVSLPLPTRRFAFPPEQRATCHWTSLAWVGRARGFVVAVRVPSNRGRGPRRRTIPFRVARFYCERPESSDSLKPRVRTTDTSTRATTSPSGCWRAFCSATPAAEPVSDRSSADSTDNNIVFSYIHVRGTRAPSLRKHAHLSGPPPRHRDAAECVSASQGGSSPLSSDRFGEQGRGRDSNHGRSTLLPGSNPSVAFAAHVVRSRKPEEGFEPSAYSLRRNRSAS